MPLFTVLLSWQSHCKSLPGSFVEWRQAAADQRPSQTIYAVSSPVQCARVYTHHRHLLLLLLFIIIVIIIHVFCKQCWLVCSNRTAC